MKRVATIQARMTSTRLPGKVLLDLGGKPVLAHVVARLARCVNVDAICIATSTNVEDDPIVDFAASVGVGVYRGSEHDVLARFVGAARACAADLVVRITADCPLIAPEIVDRVIQRAFDPDPACDYVSNTQTRRYPRGLDCEAIFTDALARADRFATSPAAREHVTWFVHSERPELFVRREVVAARDDSDLRWTLDTPEDLAMLRALYAAAGDAPFEQLLAAARANPQIVALNAHVEQKRP